MERFLQILAGYALFGENSEQVFVILNGGGANGKSTFINTLQYVLGDYATTTSPATLTRPAFNKTGSSAAPDLMRLFQKRLVLCNEWEEGTLLNESLIKSLTGGSDPISVRGLYSNNYLTYVPNYLLMLATNHIPRIASMDYGIWRRLIIVPFEINFDNPEHIDKKDIHLYEYFRDNEIPGIFNWMIEGYNLWRQFGVIESMPQLLLDMKQGYKSEMDTIGQFIDECCVKEEPKSKVKSADLYRAYNAWCIENGNKPKANRTFSSAILERGYKRTRIGTVNGFDNIRLLTLSEQAEIHQLTLDNERETDSKYNCTVRVN
jgi:putative DNA primase/helicase